jgi:hypothetical protein
MAKDKQQRARVIVVDPEKHALLKDYAARNGKLLAAVADEAISAYLVRKRVIQTAEVAA